MGISTSERARRGALALNESLTPEQRSANARRASTARHSTDALVKKVAAKLAAKEFTAEQLEMLRVALTPNGGAK